VFDGYLFTPYFIIASVLSVVLAASVMTAKERKLCVLPSWSSWQVIYTLWRNLVLDVLKKTLRIV